MPMSIKYSFTQNFHVSADRAFQWCTSYDPVDLELMHETGKRKIKRLSEDAIILSDSFKTDRDTMTKTKLVRLNPSEKSWTNTHIGGPIKYSQFLYKITPTGKDSSRLTFVGLQSEPNDLTKQEVADLARKIRAEDSGAWKLLARAMEKELGPEKQVAKIRAGFIARQVFLRSAINYSFVQHFRVSADRAFKWCTNF